MRILALLLLCLITNAFAVCEIKVAYIKLHELVIGDRSHNAMNYAIKDFNERSMSNINSLFPTLLEKECKISLSVYNAEGTSAGSVIATVESALSFYSDKITTPIILAMQYSGLSMAV